MALDLKGCSEWYTPVSFAIPFSQTPSTKRCFLVWAGDRYICCGRARILGELRQAGRACRGCRTAKRRNVGDHRRETTAKLGPPQNAPAWSERHTGRAFVASSHWRSCFEGDVEAVPQVDIGIRRQQSQTLAIVTVTRGEGSMASAPVARTPPFQVAFQPEHDVWRPGSGHWDELQKGSRWRVPGHQHSRWTCRHFSQLSECVLRER